MSKVEKGRR